MFSAAGAKTITFLTSVHVYFHAYGFISYFPDAYILSEGQKQNRNHLQPYMNTKS